jgi:hypothetical protein
MSKFKDMTSLSSRWVCMLGLLGLPIVGCGETTGAFPCTEQGIRNAIVEGGGPHFFACDGPTAVVTEAEIELDNNVILDGERNLTVDGDEAHRVFSVPEGVAAELRGFLVTGGIVNDGGGIYNEGTLTLTNSTVSGNSATVSGDDTAAGGGIYNEGTLTLINSTVSANGATVSGNGAAYGGGIRTSGGGTVMLTNTTVWGNTADYGGGIYEDSGDLTLTHSTVSRNTANYDGSDIFNSPYGVLTLTNTLGWR